MISEQRKKLLAEKNRANWIPILLSLDRQLYPDALLRPNTDLMSKKELMTHAKDLLKKAYCKKSILEEIIKTAELEFWTDGKTEDWRNL